MNRLRDDLANLAQQMRHQGRANASRRRLEFALVSQHPALMRQERWEARVASGVSVLKSLELMNS